MELATPIAGQMFNCKYSSHLLHQYCAHYLLYLSCRHCCHSCFHFRAFAGHHFILLHALCPYYIYTMMHHGIIVDRMVGTTSTSKMEEFSSCGFTQGQLKINPLLWAKLHVVLFVWALCGIDSKSSLWPSGSL